MNAAASRVEASRERLRAVMSPPPAVKRPDERKASWTRKIRVFPVMNAVIESVQSWWSNHPLKPVAQVASEASNALVKPLASRSPFVLVLGAAGIGAALVWSRPWRWIFRSALFAGLVPQLASRVVSSLPIESWMSMFGTVLSQPRPPSPPNANAVDKASL